MRTIENNQITFATYPPLYLDREWTIENPNYDNEATRFTVKYDWFLNFIHNFGETEDEWFEDYTWDNTCYLLDRAFLEGALIKEETVLRTDLEEDLQW